MNTNNIQPIYKNDYHKVKFLRVLLNVNQVLIIPPYWFYSIKFLEENTIVFLNSYRTFTSSIAIIPELFIQLLQQNNLKLNIIKKKDHKSETVEASESNEACGASEPSETIEPSEPSEPNETIEPSEPSETETLNKT